MPWLLYCLGKRPLYPLDRRLDGPQSAVVKGKNPCPCWELNCSYPALGPVTDCQFCYYKILTPLEIP